MLKAKFIGAAGTVTGASTLLQHNEDLYLIDCGMYQGFPGSDEKNRRPFRFDPKRLAAVLLTHAHVDHIGLLPRLVDEGFRGRVICTRATADFTKVALRDPAAGAGLWSPEAVHRLESMFHCPDDDPRFTFGFFQPLGQDLFYGFFRTAHVVGSVAIEIRATVSTSKDDNLTVTFSGDLGPCADGASYGGLQKERQYPNPATRVVVCESTYGGRNRRPEALTSSARLAALGDVVSKALGRGPDPVIVIPAFSLQRSQDLLVELHQVFGDPRTQWPTDKTVTIHVDSSMAQEHARIMCEALRLRSAKGKRRYLNTKSPLVAGMADEQVDDLLSRLLAPECGYSDCSAGPRSWRIAYGNRGDTAHVGPRVILAGPGMCTGGKILKHLAANVSNPAATIVFTGYLPTTSPGHRLRQFRNDPATFGAVRSIAFGDATCDLADIRATIEDLSEYYSGHTDEAGLVDFILGRDTGKPAPPVAVVLNHGDRVAREALKKRLEQTAAGDTENRHRPLKRIYLPEWHNGWLDLATGEWEPSTDLSPDIEDRLVQIERAVADVLNNQEAILRRLGALDQGG